MNRFEARRKRAQQLMVEQEVAALQVTSRENYYYLTGDVRSVARLFLPQEGEPTIIVFDEEVEAAAKASGIKDIRGWRTPSQLMQNFFHTSQATQRFRKESGFLRSFKSGFFGLQVSQSKPQDEGYRKRRNLDAPSLC